MIVRPGPALRTLVEPSVAVLVAALLVAIWPSTTRAETALQQAKIHYERGEASYNAAQYKESIREFKFAYELSHRPELLIDLARAEGKLGEEATAIAYLKQYVAVAPGAVDVGSVRSEIVARETLLADVEARKRAEAERDSARVAAERAAALDRSRVLAERDRDLESTGRKLRISAGVAVGVGAACLLGGVALGIVAAHDAHTVTAGSGEFSGSVADADARGPTAFRAGIALDIVGGIVALAGAGLFVYATRSAARGAPEHKPSTTAVWLAPSGGGLTVAGRF